MLKKLTHLVIMKWLRKENNKTKSIVFAALELIFFKKQNVITIMYV